jgi:hypothetical protein
MVQLFDKWSNNGPTGAASFARNAAARSATFFCRAGENWWLFLPRSAVESVWAPAGTARTAAQFNISNKPLILISCSFSDSVNHCRARPQRTLKLVHLFGSELQQGSS